MEIVEKLQKIILHHEATLLGTYIEPGNSNVTAIIEYRCCLFHMSGNITTNLIDPFLIEPVNVDINVFQQLKRKDRRRIQNSAWLAIHKFAAKIHHLGDIE